MWNACTKCPEVTECGHVRVAASDDCIAHKSYMRGVHLKRKLK